jgi:hypothetical protein
MARRDDPQTPRGGITRGRAPRAVQEPVAAPRSRFGYPVGFAKRITGLFPAEEGLLVKDITKSLTLSLPDPKQFMTNSGARRGQADTLCVP